MFPPTGFMNVKEAIGFVRAMRNYQHVISIGVAEALADEVERMTDEVEGLADEVAWRVDERERAFDALNAEDDYPEGDLADLCKQALLDQGYNDRGNNQKAQQERRRDEMSTGPELPRALGNGGYAFRGSSWSVGTLLHILAAETHGQRAEIERLYWERCHFARMAAWFANNPPGTPVPDWCFLEWGGDRGASTLAQKEEAAGGKEGGD